MNHFGRCQRSLLKTTWALIVATALSGGCQSKATQEASEASSRKSATGAELTKKPANQAPTAWAQPEHTPLPSGPVFAVFPGQGVGPIRFGAHLATIERHMQAPCETKAETLCRYPSKGIEFGLKDGVLTKIQINAWFRPLNPAGGAARWGMFNGGIPPDLKFGMLPWAIQEKLGAPTRVEQVNGGPTRERHYYPGMVLEYDQLENGKSVLGGIHIEKAPT